MNSIVILHSFFILSIISLCRCGNDNEGEITIDRTFGGSYVQKCGNTSVRDIDSTIDLSCPNSRLCKTFEYYYDGNYIHLIIPHKSIKKLANKDEFVWEAQVGETLEYVKGYLKNGKPEFALIVTSTCSGATWKWYVRKWDTWIKCTQTYDIEMGKLKVVVSKNKNFILNIEDKESTEECTTFKADILGAPVMLYFANPGYHAMEVRHGSTIIWKASKNERCIACDLYSENNEPSFILVVIKNGNHKVIRYFEKMGNEWKDIRPNEFTKRLAMARKVHPKDGYHISEDERGKNAGRVVTPENRPWWSACLSTVTSGLPVTTFLASSSPFNSYSPRLLEEREKKQEITNQPIHSANWDKIEETLEENQKSESNKKND